MANPARLFQIWQAALILLSVTFNLHSGVYDVRGGRKIIRDPYLNSFPEKFSSICSMVLPASIGISVQDKARGSQKHLFPTCQVRVVRFYQSCSPPPPPPLPPPPPHPPPPSSQSRSQWAQPDLHRELQIPVGTAGPPPRAPDPSGHSRTSTATSRSQWALPDLNRDFQVAVGTAGPQPRLPDRSGHCRTSTATSRSQWALPDINGKNVRKDIR